MKKIIVCFLLLAVTIVSCKKLDPPPGPSITSFTPDKLSAYNYVEIRGVHFDSVAANNTVTFNGLATTIFKVNGDSLLTVVVPKNVKPGKITVTVNGVTATSANSYTVLAGSWTRKTDLPAPTPPNGRALGIGFAINNTGYMGLGTDNGEDFKDLYAYDPVTEKWTEKTSLPIGLEQAVCMVINDKAYAGIGENRAIGDETKQFFEYDPSADKWTAMAEFPGVKRMGAIGIGVGNMGYAGLDSYQGLKDWWQYDPAANAWTRKADFPRPYTPGWPFGFAVNNKIYIGGNTSLNPIINEWWQYDPATDKWTQKNNFPGYLPTLACGVVIGNIGYVMGGGDENWQYDDVSDTWVQKAFFKGRLAGSAFSIGNKGYYGTGRGLPSSFLNVDFWEYTPE